MTTFLLQLVAVVTGLWLIVLVAMTFMKERAKSTQPAQESSPSLAPIDQPDRTEDIRSI
jgi:preprotein translocase subunit SecG